MNRLLNWWYRVSLPKRAPDTTPLQRERTRYARLTSAFSLLLLTFTVLLSPFSVVSRSNPSAPKLMAATLCAILLAIVLNKRGWNIAAATMIILSTLIEVVGTMLTDPSNLGIASIFGALVVPVIVAGALMPPSAALVTGGVNSVLIVLIVFVQLSTAGQAATLNSRLVATLVALPVSLQLIVAVITYIIMRNLIAALRRADRAEEIIALQKAIAEAEQTRVQEQQLLQEGIKIIADVHSQIANGNLDVRVPLDAHHILWQVAIPLNTLLKRVQRWKWSADQSERAQTVASSLVKEMQKARMQQVPPFLPQQTGTWLDPLIVEIHHLSATQSNAEHHQPDGSAR
ncbi:MAG TPA: hypothetical protein VKR06_32590 [Ktedonosporobacter sp.]|nr:hypothetical protein [Ktedonosporobacter sp.]